MKPEFTIEEFDRLLKENKKLKQAWDNYLSFERWLSTQNIEVQNAIDNKCREYIQQLNGKED
jgi:hypothetical protein